jgi:hypothetical protein
MHSIADVHVDPFVFCTQTLPTQLKPATQSELPAQLVLHVVAPQTYGLHDFSIPAAHVPVASHRPATVWAPAMHESMPQTVPTAYLRHAPAPSHAPSRPQVEAPASLHCPPGSCPSGTFLQVPSLPLIAHDLQVPVHAVMQQRPCAQIFELHSASAPQIAPIGFGPQLPLWQLLGATQSASVMHVVRQVLPSVAH